MLHSSVHLVLQFSEKIELIDRGGDIDNDTNSTTDRYLQSPNSNHAICNPKIKYPQSCRPSRIAHPEIIQLSTMNSGEDRIGGKLDIGSDVEVEVEVSLMDTCVRVLMDRFRSVQITVKKGKQLTTFVMESFSSIVLVPSKIDAAGSHSWCSLVDSESDLPGLVLEHDLYIELDTCEAHFSPAWWRIIR